MAKNQTQVVVLPKALTKAQEVAVDVAERDEILQEFTQAERAVYERLEELFNSEVENVIRNRYEIGGIAIDVTAQNGGKKYGAKLIERLAKVLGRNASIIYDAKRFAELYSETELEKLLEVRSRSGLPLMWSHIEALIHLPDGKLRKTMLEATLAENLTPKQLQEKIQKHFGGPRGNSSGRPLTKPKNLEGYLDSIITTSDVVVKKAETVWCGGDKTIKDVAEETETIDEKTFKKIDDALDKLSDTIAAVGDTAKQLTDLREELTERNAKRVLADAEEEQRDEDEADEQDEKDIETMTDEEYSNSMCAPEFLNYSDENEEEEKKVTEAIKKRANTIKRRPTVSSK